jgi:hypothetical protein
MGTNDNFYPPAMRENPKGFFENVRFRRMNDKILKKENYHVKSFDADVPQDCLPDLPMRRAMCEVINEQCAAHNDWGWKDPRTSLTLYHWLSVLAELRLIKEVHVIATLRAPLDIANSMRARGNKEKVNYQFETLASSYYHTVFRHVLEWRHCIAGYHNVKFNDLMLDTETTLEKLGTSLGRNLKNNGFIDYAAISRNISGRTLRTA